MTTTTAPTYRVIHPPRVDVPAEVRQAVIAQIRFEFPLLDVAERFGIQLKKRGPWMEACCPFTHNHADAAPSFKIRASGDTYHCFGCGETGNIFSLARELEHQHTFSAQVAFLTGRTWSDWLAGVPQSPAERARMLADIEARQQTREQRLAEEAARWRSVDDPQAGPVYETLLTLLRLEPKEQRELEARGFTREAALKLGYRTLPANRQARIALCKQLQRGYSLERVPGFFQLPPDDYKAAGAWCFAGNYKGVRAYYDRDTRRTWETRGLLIPLRDEAKRVIQLKVRNNSLPANLPERFQRYWPPKYMILSSEERIGGARPAVKAHFAGPRDGGSFPGILWVTEGEIKADLSSLLLDARFCGLPGASQCPHLALSAAIDGGYSELRVAMDVEDKNHVKWAIARLCREAQAAGLNTSVVVWDGAQPWRNGTTKGIDDLLAANGSYRILSYQQWWDSLAVEIQQYVTQRLNG